MAGFMIRFMKNVSGRGRVKWRFPTNTGRGARKINVREIGVREKKCVKFEVEQKLSELRYIFGEFKHYFTLHCL